MLKSSGLILRLSEGICMSVVVVGVGWWGLSVLKYNCLYGGIGFEMIAAEVRGMDSKYTWEI
jgi:hypothetical protein